MKPAATYLELRDAITRISPIEHGLVPTAELPNAWGALVDVGLPAGPVTIVAIADGTTSLYLGNGGATVGVGTVPSIRELTASLLRAVDAAVRILPPTWELPVPPTGWLQVVALTFEGMLLGRAAIPEVEGPAHPLSDIWRRSGELATAVSALGSTGPPDAGGTSAIRR